jgi:hypothetical protein
VSRDLISRVTDKVAPSRRLPVLAALTTAVSVVVRSVIAGELIAAGQAVAIVSAGLTTVLPARRRAEPRRTGDPRRRPHPRGVTFATV